MCIHRTASKYVLWFSFNKMLHRDKNVLFGAVYIPPQGSKYSDINSFDEIETEFVDPYQNNIYDVCFLRDFNSRTKNKNDFISLDSDLIDDTRISDEFASALNAENELKTLGFSQERTSMDKGINQYGRRFLDFCKTNTLYIVNGRIGEDRYHGRVTCKGNSTVDYMVASPQLFTRILQFQLDEFSPLFSDLHSALHVSIRVHESNTKNVPDVSSVDTKSRKRIKCDDSHKKRLYGIARKGMNLFIQLIPLRCRKLYRL